MDSHLQQHVINAVMRAKSNGEMLRIRETALSIVAAIGCPHLLDAVADGLLQAGIQQRATIEMNYRARRAPSSLICSQDHRGAPNGSASEMWEGSPRAPVLAPTLLLTVSPLQHGTPDQQTRSS
jgi:hypothetical protein